MKIDLNDGWRFSPQFQEAMVQPGYDDSGMTPVRIPHTVRELPYDYLDERDTQMISCYRRVLALPAQLAGRALLLTFEGVAHAADVYVNGQLAAVHACGYTAFTVDIAPFARPGADNVVALRCDSREALNIPPFGGVIDYLTFGGVYREVSLEIRDAHHITDVFAAAGRSPQGGARLDCRLEIAGPPDADCAVAVAVLDGQRTLFEATAVTDANGIAVVSGDVPGAALWSPGAPNLYTLRAALSRGKTVVDTRELRVGFRSAEFLSGGFILNGQKLKIRGLNRHQSYPYVGYAMPARVQRLDADILKYELGLNAVRTSHYPQSRHFIERCDEIGLLVFTEMPGWQHIGNAPWKDQAVENVREMVTQYRSHPSVILWGVRINESPDDDAFYARTNEAARALDPTRATGGVRNLKKSHFFEDVYTYNDFIHNGGNTGAERKKDVTPDPSRAYLVTEYNGHMFPTKSYDNDARRVEHMLRHAAVLDAVARQDDIAGSFGWCMADYNTHAEFGSGDRICHHGVLDAFRNSKYAAALYKSQDDREPVLEIAGMLCGGDLPGGVVEGVWALTNADSVRLYRGGAFIREFFPGPRYAALPHPPILIDDFIGGLLCDEAGLTPGDAELLKSIIRAGAKYGPYGLPLKEKLKAAWLIAARRHKFDDLMALATRYLGGWGSAESAFRFEAVRGGAVVAEAHRLPAQNPLLLVSADTRTLREGATYDAASVRVRAVDPHGNTLPYCMQPLSLSVTGPLELIGPAVVPLRGGMGGLYVKTSGRAGEAALHIDAGPLGRAQIDFTVEAD